MDKAYNDSIRPYLDLAEKLRVILKGTSIRYQELHHVECNHMGKVVP